MRSLVLPLGARPRPAVSSPTQSGLTVRNLHGVNDRILVSLLQHRPESIPKTHRGSRSSSLPGNHFLLPRGHLSMRERGEWRSGEERRREEEETQTETADEMRHDIQRDSPGQTSESFFLSSSCRYLQLGLALKTQIFALTFLSFFELPEGGCSCHSLSHPGRRFTFFPPMAQTSIPSSFTDETGARPRLSFSLFSAGCELMLSCLSQSDRLHHLDTPVVCSACTKKERQKKGSRQRHVRHTSPSITSHARVRDATAY